MRTCRVLFQVDIISILFWEGVWVWNRGKNVTHASFKQKGSIAFVRTDCGGMHIVLTREHWEMDKCRWFSCQSKLLSQKGRHSLHEVEQEWLFGGEGRQEISALIPGVKFSFTWFHWPQLLVQALCCRRDDDAYTNSNHAKHFFLFAVNSHNPGHSLAAKALQHNSSHVQRLVWSIFHYPPASKQARHAQTHAAALLVCLLRDNICEFPPRIPRLSPSKSHSHTQTITVTRQDKQAV